jgi:hypothetical protein
MPDYSPQFKDLWWKNSFYLTMAFTGFFGSCCCMYYFSMKKLTLKYLLMRFCGWDEPKDTGNCLFCLNKSKAQIEKEKIARERLDAASYIPLEQDMLEAGRSAVLDGTVQKKKRVPNTQNKKFQQQQLSPSFQQNGDSDGAIELALAVRTDDRGEADKIRFEHKAGTSEAVYKGGRLKQRTHMILNNLEIVENFKKTANANIPNSVAGEEGEAQVLTRSDQAAEPDQQQLEQQEQEQDTSAADDSTSFPQDHDSAEVSGQGYSASPAATLTSVMRALFSSPRSTAKVAPNASSAVASTGDSARMTGTTPEPVGRRSGLTKQLKSAARKVVQHQAVASNPLDDEDW